LLDARSFFTLLVLIISLALQFPPTAAFAREVVNLDGYAEWRYDEFLIVEGQRVKATKSTRFSGKGAARGFDTISLGYEVKVRSRYYCEGALSTIDQTFPATEHEGTVERPPCSDWRGYLARDILAQGLRSGSDRAHPCNKGFRGRASLFLISRTSRAGCASSPADAFKLLESRLQEVIVCIFARPHSSPR